MLRLFNILILMIKNPFDKIKTQVDTIYLAFIRSEEGKEIIEQAKAKFLAAEANSAPVIEEVLAVLKDKITAITKDDTKLAGVLFDYIKGKILSSLKK